MRELSAMQLSNEYKRLAVDKLGVVDRIMADDFSKRMSSVIRCDWPRYQRLMHFTQDCREVCNQLFGPIPSRELVIPRSSEGIRPFANLFAFGLANLVEEGLRLDLWQFLDSLEIQLVRRRETVERRLVAIEGHSAPIDNRVNNRIRHTVAAFVDNWFDTYKRYKRLKPSDELENVYAQLEDAAIEGVTNGMLVVMKDSKLILEQAYEALESRLSWLPSDFDPSLIQRMVVDGLLGTLDAGEIFTAELADMRFWKRTEEAIFQSVSNACQYQVELLEKYNWSYQSRRRDYHLSIIRFNPEANLIFSIIMQAKEPQWTGKISKLAREAGIEPSKVYAFKRRLGL